METNSKILKCSCKSEFQDKLYGEGMRVMARMKQQDRTYKKYRCCNCKTEREG